VVGERAAGHMHQEQLQPSLDVARLRFKREQLADRQSQSQAEQVVQEVLLATVDQELHAALQAEDAANENLPAEPSVGLGTPNPRHRRKSRFIRPKPHPGVPAEGLAVAGGSGRGVAGSNVSPMPPAKRRRPTDCASIRKLALLEITDPKAVLDQAAHDFKAKENEGRHAGPPYTTREHLVGKPPNQPSKGWNTHRAPRRQNMARRQVRGAKFHAPGEHAAVAPQNRAPPHFANTRQRTYFRHFNLAQRGGIKPLPPPKAYQPLNHKDKMAALGLLQSSAHLHYGGMGVGLQDYMKGLPKERWPGSHQYAYQPGHHPIDGEAIAALYISGELELFNNAMPPASRSSAQRMSTPPANTESRSPSGSHCGRRPVSKGMEHAGA